MKAPALPNACSARGAEMGRHSALAEDRNYPGRFSVARLPMSSCGAYDKGGAYWGLGSPETGSMYRAFCLEYDEINERDFLVDWFIRARSRHHAKQQVLARYPAAKFYR